MSTVDLKSDLRSARRDSHRAFAKKAKWAYGTHAATPLTSTAPGRSIDAQPRPARRSDHIPAIYRHRISGSTIKASSVGKKDMLDAGNDWPALSLSTAQHGEDVSSNSSGASDSEEQGVIHALDAEDLVFGSFGAKINEPGAQVLNGALDKAMQVFEDRETARLVRKEWSILDDEGEEVGLAPEKGRKKSRVASFGIGLIDDEDYELV